MGILNRTPDSFFDAGETFALDALFRRAEQLVAEGADVLDVGGVKAGPGPEVTEAEELDRVVPALEALHARFETPLSVDTWRARRAAGGVRGRCRGRQRHQRLRRSRLSPDRREARGVGRRHPHPPGPASAGPGAAVRRSPRRRADLPRSPGRAPPKPPASRRSRSRSISGSTSARPRRRARSCCARATPSRRSATRCCCRRRASASSASSSTSRSTSAATRRWLPSRSGSCTDAGSCACTTLPDRSGCAG